MIRFIYVTLVCILISACGGQPSLQGSEFEVESNNLFGIDVKKSTNGNLQSIAFAILDAPPEVVFKKMADHENLRDWVPMIDHLVGVNHEKSITPGTSNAGTVRICNFGGDEIVEDITHWIPGRAYAYSARDTIDGPANDHLGIITIEKGEGNSSLVTWRQYFTPVGFKGNYVMPMMMSYVTSKALKNLAEEFGGEAY